MKTLISIHQPRDMCNDVARISHFFAHELSEKHPGIHRIELTITHGEVSRSDGYKIHLGIWTGATGEQPYSCRRTHPVLHEALQAAVGHADEFLELLEPLPATEG